MKLLSAGRERGTQTNVQVKNTFKSFTTLAIRPLQSSRLLALAFAVNCCSLKLDQLFAVTFRYSVCMHAHTSIVMQ